MAAPASGDRAMKDKDIEGLSTSRLKRIDEVLQRHIAAGRITGAVVAVNRRGKLVHHAALGVSDPSTGAPMPEDALFQMYSSTKPIAAAAVLMVMEEGKLRLEDPVSRYLPEFKGARVAVRKAGDTGRFVPRPPDAEPPPFDIVPANRDLTIRDLLTHVAGLGSADPRRVGMKLPTREAGESLASYARKLGAVPLDFQPGTRWSYSPLAACDVLAGIVELVSGETFDAFVTERILKPIGMNDTGFNIAKDKRARLLPVYRRVEGEWRRIPAEITGEAFILAGKNRDSGSIGLVSTAKDFLLWEQTLLNRGVAPNGNRILGSRSVELMGQNHVGDIYTGEGGYLKPITGHGFGLLMHVVIDPPNAETGRSKGAFGWGGALGTTTWNDPAEGIAAVIMIQQNVREVQVDFERAIRQAIID
jgi:CubicO group peptidase (beta-lactamase class C family)